METKKYMKNLTLERSFLLYLQVYFDFDEEQEGETYLESYVEYEEHDKREANDSASLEDVSAAVEVIDYQLKSVIQVSFVCYYITYIYEGQSKNNASIA